VGQVNRTRAGLKRAGVFFSTGKALKSSISADWVLAGYTEMKDDSS
jgi:hypothetical protein